MEMLLACKRDCFFNTLFDGNVKYHPNQIEFTARVLQKLSENVAPLCLKTLGRILVGNRKREDNSKWSENDIYNITCNF